MFEIDTKKFWELSVQHNIKDAMRLAIKASISLSTAYKVFKGGTVNRVTVSKIAKVLKVKGEELLVERDREDFKLFPLRKGISFGVTITKELNDRLQAFLSKTGYPRNFFITKLITDEIEQFEKEKTL